MTNTTTDKLAEALRDLLDTALSDPKHPNHWRLLHASTQKTNAALAEYDAQRAKPAPAGDHSAEPWTVDPEGEHATGVESARGEHVCDAYGADAGEHNARRIVACVNACAGIPTELLESLELGELDAAVRDPGRDPSHPMLGR